MIGAVLTLGATGFVAGIGLFYASKKFSVEKDPKVDEVVEILPQANCGGCGFPGCSAYADAVVAGKAQPTACPVGGMELAKNIGEILGLEIGATAKKVARVKCRGGKDNCPEKYEYYGPRDCHSIVMLSGGIKLCTFGCVGGGSCVKACNFNAMYMGDDKIPVIIEDKCTACGACVKACPRDLIVLTEMEKRFFVNCSSLDKGPEVKKSCQVGCIGCKLCQKNCPSDAITVENFLAVIDPEKCTNCGKCEEVCPTKAINEYKED